MISTSFKPAARAQRVSVRNGARRTVTVRAVLKTEQIAAACASAAAAVALGCSSASAIEMAFPVADVAQAEAPTARGALNDAFRQAADNPPLGDKPMVPTASKQTGQPGSLQGLYNGLTETLREQTTDVGSAQAFKENPAMAADKIQNQSGYFKPNTPQPQPPQARDTVSFNWRGGAPNTDALNRVGVTRTLDNAARDVSGSANSAARDAKSSLKNVGNDIKGAVTGKNKLQRGLTNTKGDLERTVKSNTPSNPFSSNPLDKAAGKAKGAANDLQRSVKNNTPSSNPFSSNPLDKAAGAAKDAAKDLKQTVSSNNPLSSNPLSSNPLDKAASKAKGAARDLQRNVRDATPNLGTSTPNDVANKVGSALNDATSGVDLKGIKDTINSVGQKQL